jgi:beta-N-acetylhexosaminidase
MRYFFTLLVVFGLIGSLSCSQHHPVSLDDAIGQMITVGFFGTQLSPNAPIVQVIEQYHIGGVFLQDQDMVSGIKIIRNIKDPQQLSRLIQDLQSHAQKSDYPRLFILVNQEGGQVNTLKRSKGFHLGVDDSQKRLAQRSSLFVATNEAYQRAKRLKKLGINTNLAPVADVVTVEARTVLDQQERSFGSDAEKVTKYLQATILGYKRAGVLCTLKHFPGSGSVRQLDQRKLADVSVSWTYRELMPYRRLIRQGNVCPIIMSGHIINRELDPSGEPASLSRPMLTEMLRHELGFRGLIMSDDLDAMTMRRHRTLTNTLKQAILAGNNELLFQGAKNKNLYHEVAEVFDIIHALAKKDPKVRARIFASYARIMRIKGEYALV